MVRAAEYSTNTYEVNKKRKVKTQTDVKCACAVQASVVNWSLQDEIPHCYKIPPTCLLGKGGNITRQAWDGEGPAHLTAMQRRQGKSEPRAARL